MFKKRKRARVLSMQALYQWHMVQEPAHLIIEQFKQHNDPNKVDLDYFAELFSGTLKRLSEINALISSLSDRSIDGFHYVELSTIQTICYELLARPEISHQVLISEGVDIAADFGAEAGYKFVNLLLDKLSVVIRQTDGKVQGE